MPVLPNAKKALRNSRRKAKVNQRIKSRYKTARKRMEEDPSQENLEKIHSAIDKAVKKNVFHKNKGARLKSQMAQLLAEAQE
jgi:small subunit ribosomal protein S20